ncbi:MAG: tryptophan--tRNA ligase [Candidatus Omnitrophica bacterium]|nr:tryptophan--tRNA ligase [Candidatus Omnitrophota bacterium]MDE2009951.1 tryptophan--tRNA ligase [Candidatus Omnitrophota bacterium]MDE2213929.1 tryptophan--tRNA ligase [Candidatus Omnitrophota bacterium]MDE2231921.1 tryptophan--tRNA ligase [Candidatus Omnitrophota bacterium]
MTKKVFSAMRPTGKLHLGHLLGALKSWAQLQGDYSCIFSIADWHALMSEYENSRELRTYGVEMAVDWMACGIDPRKSVIYLQSDVVEHLELQMFLSCLTPLGWLERNPTYKEQLREITARDLQTYAFLGYPVLQAADILLYKADGVPIGEDQLPHLELCREIARRFNSIYKKEVFSDCKAILTETPRLLGTDNRKMSKSYGNTINLSDTEKDVEKKAVSMITDPRRIKMSDPGHPEECNVYSYYKVFAPQEAAGCYEWCSRALKGCVDCKKNLSRHINKTLAPIREKRAQLEKDKDAVNDILKEGALKARGMAQKTIAQVKDAVFG